jgi:hypothetical protein
MYVRSKKRINIGILDFLVFRVPRNNEIINWNNSKVVKVRCAIQKVPRSNIMFYMIIGYSFNFLQVDFLYKSFQVDFLKIAFQILYHNLDFFLVNFRFYDYYYYFIINMGVRISLCISRLISQTLKLTTI